MTAAGLPVVVVAAAVVSVVASVTSVVGSVVGGAVTTVVPGADVVSVVSPPPRSKISGRAMASAITTMATQARTIQTVREEPGPGACAGGRAGACPGTCPGTGGGTCPGAGVAAPQARQKRVPSGIWVPQFEQYINHPLDVPCRRPRPTGRDLYSVPNSRLCDQVPARAW